MADLLNKGMRSCEVVVVFVLALAAAALLARSPVAPWERAHLLRPFGECIALALVAILAILASKAPLSSFGLTGRDLASQRQAALSCLLPFAFGKAVAFFSGALGPLSWVVDPLAAVAVIATCAWLLRPRAAGPGERPGLLLAVVPAFSGVGVGTALLFYPFVLAPAEELLFRGYIQSRLNSIFGRPWQLAHARVGGGLLIGAALFSLFHVVNLPALVVGRIDPAWASAVPTLAWGLAFGYLRERTDSLLPPMVVHGVPQALAWAFLGR